MEIRDDTDLFPVVIGLIVPADVDDAERQAVQRTQNELLSHFEEVFTQFQWRLESVWRREMTSGNRVEPMPLVDLAREERDGRDWDFVFVITTADLVAHYKTYAFASVASSVDAAVFSTARIDPRIRRPAAETELRISSISRRLGVMIRQAFGRMNALDHENDPQNIMCPITTVSDLDRLSEAGWNSEQLHTLTQNLKLIADLRLEESELNGRGTAGFYLKSCWINRHEIADAVLQAHPWEFPVRLNRLTTASFSTALILIISAESWQLAAHMSLVSLVTLAITAILTTTAYITNRQQLLVRRENRISEQSVITNVSAVCIVLFGMGTTFAMTWSLIVVAAVVLFHTEVIKQWASLDQVTWNFYGVLATLVASVSVIVGSLGASFEAKHYFRHITFVDEEI